MHQEGELRFIPLGVDDCRVPRCWERYQRDPVSQDTYATGLAALVELARSAQSVQPDAQPPAPGRNRPRLTSAQRTCAPPARQTMPAVPKTASAAAPQPAAQALPDLLTIESPIHLELVRVPAGEFLMGSDPKVDKDASGDEQPQHRLYLPEFYIGKYPVTNEQYAAFVKATRQAAPQHWENGQIPAGKGDHPVVNVSWEDAVAFCRWLSQASGKAIPAPHRSRVGESRTRRRWPDLSVGQ